MAEQMEDQWKFVAESQRAIIDDLMEVRDHQQGVIKELRVALEKSKESARSAWRALEEQKDSHKLIMSKMLSERSAGKATGEEQ